MAILLVSVQRRPASRPDLPRSARVGWPWASMGVQHQSAPSSSSVSSIGPATIYQPIDAHGQPTLLHRPSSAADHGTIKP
ncbi:hypothetical protein ACLOJK_029203 [Asimina triloba]